MLGDDAIDGKLMENASPFWFLIEGICVMEVCGISTFNRFSLKGVRKFEGRAESHCVAFGVTIIPFLTVNSLISINEDVLVGEQSITHYASKVQPFLRFTPSTKLHFLIFVPSAEE